MLAKRHASVVVDATGATRRHALSVSMSHACRAKLNSRSSKGPRVKRTMQPAAGRASGGGLRVGEMERDVLVSHGMSAMMRESFMDRSDRYACAVCRACGGRPNGDVCGTCESEDLVDVEMPYAFNLLRQELDAIGVEQRLKI